MGIFGIFKFSFVVMFVFELIMGVGTLGCRAWVIWAGKKGGKSGQKVTEIYTFCHKLTRIAINWPEIDVF